MPTFNPKNDPVHYPEDRRFRVWLSKPALTVFLITVLVPLIAAWLQFLFSGLPQMPSQGAGPALTFPLWLRATHFLNILFLTLLMRTGFSILMDHPRLYWNDDCTPNSEWARFTPIKVPDDKVWTAKDDARYISPWFALPGYRHTIGRARHWHFMFAPIWFLNGLIYVLLLFATGLWTRIVPTSWHVLPGAWSVFVNYATLHFPVETLGSAYNPLQQLSYFVIVFIFPLLTVLTGLAMSPGIINKYPSYPKMFGGRQSARSIHFLLFFGYIVFALFHLFMVAATGFVTNINHIVSGTNNFDLQGIIWGAAGGIVILAAWYTAHWISWNKPRLPQLLAQRIQVDFGKLVASLKAPSNAAVASSYTSENISSRMWPNGKLPTSEEWKSLAANGFKDFKLKVYGSVENPVELSIEEIKSLNKQDQITLHNCIQGWSGVAHWGGLPLRELVQLVRPQAEVKSVVFHSFGEGLYGGEYYDSQRLDDVFHPQCILAYEMNYQPLTELYGAPLRLRAENQLGYKMVKWIKAIEFVADVKKIGQGYGGKNEDDEYFDIVSEI